MVTPIVLVFAIVLAVQLHGSPLFVHKRLGHGGRMLTVPKLRTLAPSTDPYADKLQGGVESVSPFAAWLRRTHLDELPQLYLVPLGRLSLVGPRPRMAAEVEQNRRADYDAARLELRQGCTGLWQVGAHQHRTVSCNPEYDLFYLAHASVRLDAWILWRTVAQSLTGRGVGLDEVPQWALGGIDRREVEAERVTSIDLGEGELVLDLRMVDTPA
jgi:exopolysaccharide production protein ExoY